MFAFPRTVRMLFARAAVLVRLIGRLFLMAAYSGTTVSQVTRQLATLTHSILDRDFLMIADKEW